MKTMICTVALYLFSTTFVFAGKADVLDVKFEKTDDGYINVYATVQHDDEGTEHFADRWEMLDMEGNLLDKRILRHPHTSAPFTRGIQRARIPKEIKKIRIRAHCNVHEYGGEAIELSVPDF